jgi:meso-butanediol dehydrogenase/(S,S)-butanediol dehydrogenase/diacetyl reductase
MQQNKVAIVTGAGSGVGQALTRILVKRGVSLVVLGRSVEPLEALKAELAAGAEAGWGEVEVFPADVTDDAAAAGVVDRAVERFGRLDYVANSAGVGKPYPVDETTDEVLDFFLSVHLRAPFRLCREALRVMGDGGSIVHVASTFALIGGLRGGAYSAAKAGIIGLAQHMAAQYGPRGIRTNVVAPGVLETPMTAYNWENPRFKRMNFDMTPLNRTGTADDAAYAIAFLLSDEARFITGQVLAVDGGWSSTKFLAESAITAVPVEG